jgi:hypothetical protein
MDKSGNGFGVMSENYRYGVMGQGLWGKKTEKTGYRSGANKRQMDDAPVK